MYERTFRTNADRILSKDSRKVGAAIRGANDELIIGMTVLLENNHDRGRLGDTIVVKTARG